MEWDAEIGLYHESAKQGANPLYHDKGLEGSNPLYQGRRQYDTAVSCAEGARYLDPNLGRYMTRDRGKNENWNFEGGGTLRTFAGDNPWSRRGGSSRKPDELVFNVINPRAARQVEVMFNPKEYTITKKVTVRGWNPEKKEAIVAKEEGGRHTPFHNKDRPQFYYRPATVTGEIELPAGREMTTGMDVEYRLYGPGQAHWGSAKFTSACTLGGSKELQSWWAEAAKGKNIRKNITVNLRGHRDVGGYRCRLIDLSKSPTTGDLEIIIR
jgi:hypothetical protein